MIEQKKNPHAHIKRHLNSHEFTWRKSSHYTQTFNQKVVVALINKALTQNIHGYRADTNIHTYSKETNKYANKSHLRQDFNLTKIHNHKKSLNDSLSCDGCISDAMVRFIHRQKWSKIRECATVLCKVGEKERKKKKNL